MLDEKIVALHDVPPTTTVLDYLREQLNRRGTKEGCAEGDCGACTVALAEWVKGEIRVRAINACIALLATLDGKALLTVEDLKAEDGRLHPVQQAMVDNHASQCGFCTPGFVMSLFALYKSSAQPARREITDALAGNLCRCTGYRPIIAAAHDMYSRGAEITAPRWLQRSYSSEDTTSRTDAQLAALLRNLKRPNSLSYTVQPRFFAPRTIDELARLCEQHPDATLLAGGTDIGVWMNKKHFAPETIIYLKEVKELTSIDENEQEMRFGAALAISDVVPVLNRHYPQLSELWRRFASPPIRNCATLGGNIANASPVGDSMPALMALGTSLELRDAQRKRIIMLDSFFVDYKQTILRKGEFISHIRVPTIPAPGSQFRVYKLSKRFDQDISTVCAAFWSCSSATEILDARIAFGGLSAIPKRARACEAELIGSQWDLPCLQRAQQALRDDFSPLDDMRASSAYRIEAAGNLLRKFFLETLEANAMTNLGNVTKLQHGR